MRAIRVHEFGAPEVMQVEDVPDPKPGTGQVLVRIRAAGVNPVDTYIRAGIYGQRTMPYTPGLDGAGTVEALGEGVTRVQTGQRVYVGGSLTGTYAELALCREQQVHSLPDDVSFEQGAGVHVPYGTAYSALFLHGQAKAGETVLVHGASGGVGIAAVQIARAAGLTVFGTAGTEEGRKLVFEQGAHHVLDHRSPGYLEQGRDLAGGGFNLILEMLANVNLANDLKVLSDWGRVVVIGSRGKIEIDPRDTMGRCSSILGMTLLKRDDQELIAIHAALRAGLENGTLRPIVGQRIPLGEAPRAHHEVIESRAYGKIVLLTS